MQQSGPREPQGMFGRYLLFIVLSFGILALSLYLNPPRPPRRQAQDQGAVAEGAKEGPKKEEQGKSPAAAEKEATRDRPDGVAEEPSPKPERAEAGAPGTKDEPAQPPRVAPKARLITLGSLDPDSPYRMLVIVTNQGAAVGWIELNSKRFHDLEDRTGYLGHLGLDTAAEGRGRRVDVVGPGTPGAKAGLERGDLITAIDGQAVTSFESLRKELDKTRPGQQVTLTVLRKEQRLRVPVTLERRPLEVVRPEFRDPLSFLCTLSKVDDREIDERRGQLDKLRERLEALKKKVDEAAEGGGQRDASRLEEFNKELVPLRRELARLQNKTADDSIRFAFDDLRVIASQIDTLGVEMDDLGRVHLELEGLDLRSGTWDIENEAQFDAAGPHTKVTFFHELREVGLKISKTFVLEASQGQPDDAGSKGYHLALKIKIENIGDKARDVAYQLDGATGLPLEGEWYANKVSRKWGRVGLRDVVHAWEGGTPITTSCYSIADDDLEKPWEEQRGQNGQEAQLLAYMGVDAQYFCAMLIPEKEAPGEIWFHRLQPLRVGGVDKIRRRTTNTSCRLTSTVQTLAPGGKPLEHEFTVFAGPKQPALLAEYGLEEMVYYGWYGWVAVPMLAVLHFFHSLVGNYGLAIIMLTVLVRSCMFPLSRKQVLGAQKMQEIQPELKKIHEKYKNNMEARARAQRELFKKHNYNPASGCLVLLFQLPIFVGLYRGLMVDVELRQAPLIPGFDGWCSNLAAPDMLFPWTSFMPSFVTDDVGLVQLGPYFNLLPILTVFLFVLQQKMFMPPPSDEKQAMQHKMMKYMMLLMGFIFFKVSSGLCLYFIASSLWGVAERKLLPKPPRPGSGATPKTPRPEQAGLPVAKAGASKPAESEPVKAAAARPRPVGSGASRGGGNPGGGGRRKKKKRKRSRGRK